MAKMGRPRKEIDQKSFESLCAIQCTLDEVCDFFGVTDKTLNSWCKRTYGTTFSDVFAQKRGIGRISLRRYQYEMAKHNPTMAIWLGKQYLKQTDRIQVDQTAVLSHLDAVLADVKAEIDEGSAE